MGYAKLLLRFIREVRVAITPRHALLKATLSNGAVVLGRNRAGFGGRGVYIMRDELERELNSLEHFLESDGVFLDIGANTGVYTLKAARHYGRSGIVIAVEPFPATLAVLSESVAKNNFENVRLRNFCIGAKTGVGELWLNRGKPNSFGLKKHDERARSISVLIVSLDDLLTWEKVSRLDYVKIDAEGAEEDILKGGRESIARFRPIIQLETTVARFRLEMDNYSFLAAQGSPNVLCVPNEHPRHETIRRLGWEDIVAR